MTVKTEPKPFTEIVASLSQVAANMVAASAKLKEAVTAFGNAVEEKKNGRGGTMSAVYFIDSTGRAIADTPKGALVRRLPEDRKVSISQHNPDAMPVTYMSSDIPGAVFWVSDGIETTADYGHPLEALDAWQGGEVFKENVP